MDIITSTKSCALDMEHNNTENKAVTLRQHVSNILQKNLNLKIRSDLKKRWKKSITRITKQNDKIRVPEFDKGCGFAIVTNDTAKEKVEDELGKETKAKIDLSNRLTNKIQKIFANLEKKTNLQTRFIQTISIRPNSTTFIWHNQST